MALDTMPRDGYLDMLRRAQASWGTLARLAVCVGGYLLVDTVHGGHLPRGAAASILFYSTVVLLIGAALTISSRASRRGRSWPLDLDQALLLALVLMDLVFISLLVLHTGGSLSEAYLLYPFAMLEMVLSYPVVPGAVVVAILSGPAYAGVLFVQAGGWFFLSEPYFLWRYGLLLISALSAYGLGLRMARECQRRCSLQAAYRAMREDIALKAVNLRQTAGALSGRVQQLRMLQEGIKAISSSLALEDLLSLIVTNAAQVVRGERCALTLADEETGAIVTRAVSDLPTEVIPSASLPIGEGFAAWVVQHGKAIRINHAADDPRLSGLADWPVASLISVPLIANGRPIGALTATSPREGAFTEEDLEALSTFAAQAVVAVINARLYTNAQERRREIEAILKSIGDAVIAADPRLRLTLLNPIAADLLGLSQSAAGQPVDQVLDADLTALFRDALVSTHQPLRREVVLPGGGDQPPRFFQALASTILGEGEVRGIVVVLRDISEQKALDQAKSDFLSVVSHELKTPLHSIKGFVDIILMGKTGPVSDTQRDFLGTVRQQAEALQIMINDLLESSRLEAGQINLRIERVLLGQLVQGVVARMAPLAEEAGLQIVNLVSPSSYLLQADEARLEQVITNLLSNAIKFTQTGSITIRAADLGDEIQVSVADTGIGIPSAQLERIFERFYQVDGTTTRRYRGAGLGLTICKHIVEYHGGRIWAESVEGQGSTFHFVLPKVQPADEQPAMDFSVLPPR